MGVGQKGELAVESMGHLRVLAEMTFDQHFSDVFETGVVVLAAAIEIDVDARGLAAMQSVDKGFIDLGMDDQWPLRSDDHGRQTVLRIEEGACLCVQFDDAAVDGRAQAVLLQQVTGLIEADLCQFDIALCQLQAGYLFGETCGGLFSVILAAQSAVCSSLLPKAVATQMRQGRLQDSGGSARMSQFALRQGKPQFGILGIEVEQLLPPMDVLSETHFEMAHLPTYRYAQFEQSPLDIDAPACHGMGQETVAADLLGRIFMILAAGCKQA